jgi:hypothetical protein
MSFLGLTKKTAAMMGIAVMLGFASFAHVVTAATVDISGQTDGAVISALINDALDGMTSGSVTVVSSATVYTSPDNGTTGTSNTISITIPAGVTVFWEADMTGSAANSGITNPLILTDGDGTLEIRGRAVIQNNSYGIAIRAQGAGATVNIAGNAKIYSKGIAVRMQSAVTSASTQSTLNIRDNAEIIGQRGVTNGNAVAIYSWGNVYISGNAQVINEGTGYTIVAAGTKEGVSNIVSITGGAVKTKQNAVISLEGSNKTLYMGGGALYNANGSATLSTPNIFSNGAGNGMVIERTGTNATYFLSSSEQLKITPDGAIAFWTTKDDISGISYKNGENEGFIPVEGVSVGENTNAVCEINGTLYESFGYALDNAKNGDIIKLLKNIEYTHTITISNKAITFNLNGFVLNVTTESNTMTVVNGRVDLIGAGVFNLECATNDALYADNSTVTVSNLTSASKADYSVYVTNNSKITVAGDVVGRILAKEGASVTVDGDVTNSVIVIEEASVYAFDPGTTVTIGGNVTGIGNGVGAYLGAVVHVEGDVTGGYNGIAASGGDTKVTVNGNVSGKYIGVEARNNARVDIAKNVSGKAAGVFAQAANVNIAGGVSVSGDYERSLVTELNGIYGTNVDLDYYSTGVIVLSGGAVTVEKEITLSPNSAYAAFADGSLNISVKSKGDYKAATTKAGYLTYTDNASNVWVKESASPIITTASPLPDLISDEPYTFGGFTATGSAPITWSVVGGNLPSGITLNSNGTITKTSTLTKGTYNFTVKAANNSGSDIKAFSLRIIAPSVPVTKPALTQTTYTYTGSSITVSLNPTSELYTLGGEITKTNVGTYTATVTLKDPSNDQWEGGGSSPLPLSWTIDKSSALTATAPHIMISSANTNPNTFDLTGIVLNKTDHGALTYKMGSSFANGQYVLVDQPTLVGSILTYTGGGKAGGAAMQSIIIESQNYDNVEVTVTFEATTIAFYSITVQTDGNGTASANVTSAASGAEITLTAAPNSGYRFKEWQVVSGGVTVSSANKFTMPSSAVTVKAVFELIPAIPPVTPPAVNPDVAADGVIYESGKRVGSIGFSGETVSYVHAGRLAIGMPVIYMDNGKSASDYAVSKIVYAPRDGVNAYVTEIFNVGLSSSSSWNTGVDRLSATNGVVAGRYDVTVEVVKKSLPNVAVGKSNAVTFTIRPRNINEASVALDMTTAEKVYDGSAKSPRVNVKDGSYNLVARRGERGDYEVEIPENATVGTWYVSVVGAGNYTGKANVPFTIVPAEIAINQYASYKFAKEYDGTMDVDTSAYKVDIKFTGLTREDAAAGLRLGEDYIIKAGTLKYNSKDAGTNKTVSAVVELTNSAVAKNYKLKSGSFSVNNQVINKGMPKPEHFIATYGSPAVVLKVDGENNALFNNAAKTVNAAWKSGITNSGSKISVNYGTDGNKAPVVIGDYVITVDVTEGANFALAKGIALGTLSIREALPPIIVSYKPESKDTSYHATNSVTIGVVAKAPEGGKGSLSYQWFEVVNGDTVRVKGKTAKDLVLNSTVMGQYSYQVLVTYKGSEQAAVSVLSDAINVTVGPAPVSLRGAIVTVNKEYEYDGNKKDVASGDVQVTLAGNSLSAGQDYKIKSVTNNINAGVETAVVTIEGINGYKDTETGRFTINKKQLTISDLTILYNVEYNGKTQEIKVTPKSGMSGIGEITRVYNPENVARINAGKWEVTLSIADGMNFVGIESLPLPAAYVIREAELISVAKGDREIPGATTSEEAALVPVKSLSGNISVGPNPVKAGNCVAIYWTGSRAVSGKLGVFDAVGGRVNVLEVSGTKRIGAWKAGGVAEGTYLIKGVLTDKDGVKFRVSGLVAVVR